MASISPQDFGFAVAVFGVMTLCKRSISGIFARMKGLPSDLGDQSQKETYETVARVVTNNHTEGAETIVKLAKAALSEESSIDDDLLSRIVARVLQDIQTGRIAANVIACTASLLAMGGSWWIRNKINQQGAAIQRLADAARTQREEQERNREQIRLLFQRVDQPFFSHLNINNLDEMIEFFTCPIGNSLISDPLWLDNDGHLYERNMIQEWYDQNPRNQQTPLRRAPMDRPPAEIATHQQALRFLALHSGRLESKVPREAQATEPSPSTGATKTQ
jgi:hypothetical protein